MRSIDLKGDILINLPVQNAKGQTEIAAQTIKRTDMIVTIIERPAQGYSTGELRVAFKLLDAAVDAGKTGAEALLVEDDQFAILADLLQKFRWATTSASVIAFIEAVEGAAEVKPNKAGKAA